MLEPKLLSSYTTPIDKTIHLITLQEDVEPVGSFAYKIFYPGDIDIREQITECCDAAHAASKVATDIQRIVANIVAAPGYYVAEFKAGLDKRYPNNRDKYILRWSDREILLGYKTLPGNIHYSLEQALGDPTIVKLDMWAPLNSRYVEVSNFLIIMVEHEDGSITPLNGEQPDYIQSIRGDVYFYLTEGNNIFKATKRMMLLARSYKDEKMLEKILPLINSSAGLVYQVMSDMHTLEDMIEKLGSRSPYEFIYREIDNFKERLSYISDFDFSEMRLDEIIDGILHNQLKNDRLLERLDDMASMLLDVLNRVSLDYDTKVGIIPPPKAYISMDV